MTVRASRTPDHAVTGFGVALSTRHMLAMIGYACIHAVSCERLIFEVA